MKFVMRKCLWALIIACMGYLVFLFVTGSFDQTHTTLLVGCAATAVILTIGKGYRKVKYLPRRILRKVLRLWL